MHSHSDPYIKATKDTKTFRKPPKKEELQKDPEPVITPIIQYGNETIIEGEITIINADDLDVISFNEKSKESPNEGISTQILPLSRLSISSNNSNSPPNSGAKAEKVDQTPTGRPIAEVQPFNNSDSDQKRNSPVRDKLDKIRRSLTEPLIQYFHDLQSSPDSEEPEVLNTPKSIAPPTLTKNGIKSKNLFQDDEVTKRPPPMVTDM